MTIVIIMFLLLVGFVDILILLSSNIFIMPDWCLNNMLYFRSIAFGGFGGILYCLRAVYLNKCVYKSWDSSWHVWYFLRPVTSTITGGVSSIFLKSGVLILDAKYSNTGNEYGFWALAFIAGYNVDFFLKKLETIAKSIWGIEPSRASKTEE